MSEAENKRYRWVVNYTHPECMDDLDLMRSSLRAIFDREEDAKHFAEGHVFHKRPDYWQPRIYCEESYLITTTHWKEKK